MVTRVLFNRQPVYDRHLQVIGYEIVSEKPQNEGSAPASVRQVLSELEEKDVNTLASDGRLFLDSTPMQFSESEWMLPPGKSVLQIQLPAAGESDVSLQQLKSLVEKRHQIALTGLNYYDRPEFLRLADVVKLDVALTGLSDLELTLDRMRRFKGKLLADKVGTQKKYQACHELGFDYFQGFFYCQPAQVPRRSVPVSQSAIMRLLARIQDPDVDLPDLEKIISRDAALCFRLLRYLNSAGFGLTRKVDSVSRAINLLGLEPLKIWCSVILLSRLEGKPVELVKTSLTRARMCQALAEQGRDANPSAFFMTGLFSLLPAYMDRPMEDIVNELPLTDEIAKALVEGEGSMGGVLGSAIDYERGEWKSLEKSAFGKQALRSAYLDAVHFTEESVRRLV